MHHFFTPDLSGVDDGYDRVDMNPQFVLLVCRDYLWTGDREYLARMWPHIEKAMDNTQLLDGDGDGLPDHDTRANTYDAWAMQGTPAYIASLWLAALKAAVRMAQDLGAQDRAAAWEALLEKGSKAFVEKLWNGRYFSLWADGDKRDDCCMTDQIDGQWYARLLGLGNFLPQDKIDTATDCILSENFRPESGLVNASYPAQATPTLYTWKMCRWRATGPASNIPSHRSCWKTADMRKPRRSWKRSKDGTHRMADASTTRNVGNTTIVRWHPGQCYSL